jgi:hypothetical protein
LLERNEAEISLDINSPADAHQWQVGNPHIEQTPALKQIAKSPICQYEKLPFSGDICIFIKDK